MQSSLKILRSSNRLRSPNYSNFLSDTLSSSDDNKPTIVLKKVKSAPTQKKGRKKKLKKLDERSQSSVEEPTVEIKKKIKKEKKKAPSPVKRKIIKGKRRLENHDTIATCQVVKSPKFKEEFSKAKSPKIRMCRASPPLLKLNEFNDISSDNITSIMLKQSFPKNQVAKENSPNDKEDKENEEYLTASDFSSPLKSAPIKTNQIFSHEEDKIETLIGSQMFFENKFNGSFEIDDSNEKFVEGTFEILKENGDTSRRSNRRETFDVINISNDVRTSKKWAINEQESVKIIEKTKRRGTYEVEDDKSQQNTTYKIENFESPEKTKKRDTFEVPEDDSFIMSMSTIKGKKKQFKSEKKNNSMISMKTPHLAPKMKAFNLNLHSKELDVKFSDSQSSAMTDSGMTSASVLLRHAHKLNPPSDTSTPNISIKHSSPKSTKTVTDSKRPQNSKVKRMPNYAAIHKNRYDKMESLDDHVQRKKMRANALLSGAKVPLGNKGSSKETTTKKQLFTSSSLDTPNKSISFRDAHQRKLSLGKNESPLARKHLAAGDATVAVLQITKRPTLKKAVSFNVKSSARPSVTFAKTPKPTREQVWKAFGTKIPQSTAAVPNIPGCRNISVVRKLGKDGGGIKEVALRRDPASKKETLLKDIKSVSTKSKASTTSVDTRRGHIKGVRSNRRFDLLMNMRKMS